MRPPSPRRDPAWREAERRRRRRVGHRRLATAVGTLLVVILAVGLGVGLGARGGGKAATTGSSVAGSSSTAPLTGGSTTSEAGATSSSSTSSLGTSSTGTSSTGTTAGTTARPLVFQAQLTGDSVVPPVDTPATGTLTLAVAADLSKVDFSVAVKNIDNLTVARLHQGKAGQTGSAIATLYAGPTKSGAFTGVLEHGSFAASDLSGPLAGKKISDLAVLLKSGSVYLSIGTTAHRGGEIRGQLRGPASSTPATSTSSTAGTEATGSTSSTAGGAGPESTTTTTGAGGAQLGELDQPVTALSRPYVVAGPGLGRG